jgi:Pol polyprotein
VTAISKDSSNNELWGVIININDKGKGKTYSTLSALINNVVLTADSKPNVKLYNLGTFYHMFPFHHCFTNLCSILPHPITAANGKPFYAIDISDLKIAVPNNVSTTPITLKNTLYAPNMGLTIVSISCIATAGYSITFKGNICKIKDKKGAIMGSIATSPNGLYKVKHPLMAVAAAKQVNILMLHQRLSHIAVNTIWSLIYTNTVIGLHLIDSHSHSQIVCNLCNYAKVTRKTIHKESTLSLAEAFSDEVHSNIWGPSSLSSLDGYKYYISFTDDYIHFTLLYMICHNTTELQSC